MFKQRLKDHIKCLQGLSNIEPLIIDAGFVLSKCINDKKKILICGNGGSAADSQHFTAEIVGRFQKERPAFSSIALTTDTSIITAIGNDYSYADIFSRQIEALGNKGDVFIGLSTSGNSENIIRAVHQASNRGIFTIGLLGKDGGRIKNEVDSAVIVNNNITARIQEAHIFILHFWAEIIEENVNN